MREFRIGPSTSQDAGIAIAKADQVLHLPVDRDQRESEREREILRKALRPPSDVEPK
jgi:hypothetical protein